MDQSGLVCWLHALCIWSMIHSLTHSAVPCRALATSWSHRWELGKYWGPVSGVHQENVADWWNKGTTSTTTPYTLCTNYKYCSIHLEITIMHIVKNSKTLFRQAKMQKKTGLNSQKVWSYSIVLFESRKIRFSMQENIEIDTKIIQIHEVHAFLWAKPFSADAFGIHLEKWPPSWIFEWHVRQIC